MTADHDKQLGAECRADEDKQDKAERQSNNQHLCSTFISVRTTASAATHDGASVHPIMNKDDVKAADPNNEYCLIENCPGAEHCHAVPKASNDHLLNNLEWRWNMRHPGDALHRLYDESFWALLPPQDIVDQYYSTLTNIGPGLGIFVERKSFVDIPIFEATSTPKIRNSGTGSRPDEVFSLHPLQPKIYALYVAWTFQQPDDANEHESYKADDDDDGVDDGSLDDDEDEDVPNDDAGTVTQSVVTPPHRACIPKRSQAHSLTLSSRKKKLVQGCADELELSHSTLVNYESQFGKGGWMTEALKNWALNWTG
ncbi:hypothetical protein CPB83DRAFT_881232 [Crepidotus variabilis]|uniref:Uncharacterized protein n=1 Tax=Crepidotus variabilis TaxID=179855 RepID=A0A9P6JS48_9AGAR|nr:hypothetical protein CPB83DRAFT_881232 [Crepidotus variabilis]